ncbi:MAG: hypothetical protein ABI557_11315 [Aureliella sp.]
MSRWAAKLTSMYDPPGVTRDRYCSPNVTLETAWAIYVELEPLAELRCAFMFWKGDRMQPGLTIDKPRIRDLRPGDTLVLDGWKRLVEKVEIYR